jgi:hypothetical protein
MSAPTHWSSCKVLLKSNAGDGRKVGLISWVNEGHEIAARTIYRELPHVGTLPDDYETKALPIVNEQLKRAGVRLATVLNASLEQ